MIDISKDLETAPIEPSWCAHIFCEYWLTLSPMALEMVTDSWPVLPSLMFDVVSLTLVKNEVKGSRYISQQYKKLIGLERGMRSIKGQNANHR